MSPDSAAVADRVEDENCNGDMESMEMDMDSEIATDHPAASSDADLPCSNPPVTAATSSSSSSFTCDDIHSISWFVFCTLEILSGLPSVDTDTA